MNNDPPISILVHGAAGRMGRRVVALATSDPQTQVIAAIDHDASESLGLDAGTIAGEVSLGIPILSRWPSTHATSNPVVIDFSLPVALEGCLHQCVTKGLPLVLATTGFDDAQKAALHDASQTIPIVWAPSMSLAVNVSMRVCQQITRALRDVAGGIDVEIIERHHRFKADAPSGTALRFAELISDELRDGEVSGETKFVHGREGHTGQRTRGEIGLHAVRVGDNPGEHTIVFGMLGEKIELNVAASNRDCYATGAIAAAKWIIGQKKPPGLYSMAEVLGL